MRKVLILIFIFLISCVSYPNLTQEESISIKIIEFHGFKKDFIYDQSLEWIAVKWRSSKEIIEVRDKKVGKIIGHIVFDVNPPKISGTLDFYPASKYTVFNNLIIESKDGKARVKIEAVSFITHYEGEELRPMIPAPFGDVIKEEHKKIFNDYESYIKEKAAKNVNW